MGWEEVCDCALGLDWVVWFRANCVLTPYLYTLLMNGRRSYTVLYLEVLLHVSTTVDLQVLASPRTHPTSRMRLGRWKLRLRLA